MTLWFYFVRTVSFKVFLVTILSLQIASLGTAARAQTSASAHPQFAKLLADPLPGHPSLRANRPSTSLTRSISTSTGGADVYLLYDFQLLLHQDFKAGAADMTADVYDMGRPEDAFGIYSAERSPKFNYIPVGAEGYRSKGVLNFFQDRYYVKLSGSGASVDAQLDQLAHTLSTRIGGSRSGPPLLLKLPQLQRVKHSEQYIRKDPLGHAFLAPAYVVTYASTPKESKLLVSVANDAPGAKGRLDQLAKHFKQTGECSPAAELGEGGIRAKNSFEGNIIARTQGRYVIVLLNPPPDGAALLKSTAQALR